MHSSLVPVDVREGAPDGMDVSEIGARVVVLGAVDVSVGTVVGCTVGDVLGCSVERASGHFVSPSVLQEAGSTPINSISTSSSAKHCGRDGHHTHPVSAAHTPHASRALQSAHTAVACRRRSTVAACRIFGSET